MTKVGDTEDSELRSVFYNEDEFVDILKGTGLLKTYSTKIKHECGDWSMLLHDSVTEMNTNMH